MAETSNTLSTWHEGEKFIQEKLGVAERMEEVGRRVVRNFMPDQHRDFYAQLPFIVLGSVDSEEDAWATFLEGNPGFMFSPTRTTLNIAARPNPEDPACQGMKEGDPVGLLGIEMHTRRRNRMNGVLSNTKQGFRVDVDQSFGNCPRYIQLRNFRFDRDPGVGDTGQLEALAAIDPAARALIERTDSFFVASYADREGHRQVDVSHRGGKAGFVRVAHDGMLTIPDFNGNLFFATLGNILLNGKAGLLFVDFETGDMLHMTGDAEVILESPDIAAFRGAERLWTFRARKIVRRRGGLALRWAFQDGGWSDSSLMTGDWQQADERLRAAQYAGRWRTLKISRIIQESESIRSFHLKPDDGAGLLPHVAGQHLPIRVSVTGSDKPVIRNYTLSVAPSDGYYRISVKRDGLVSQYLHDQLHEGDTIEARAPAGNFTVDTETTRPLVLMAGGVGITPMLAMLRHIVYEGLRKRRIRPTTLFYAAHSRQERAFDQELAALIKGAQGAVRLVRVLSDADGSQEGVDYDVTGRIDMPLLGRFLAFGDYEFYLCGPPPFTQAIYDGLRGYNIADERIHAEAFGPASLRRTSNRPAAAPVRLPASTAPVPVAFMNSLKEARWTPASGTLLELAEARGLHPEFSCREGTCGTCRSKLIKGTVAYLIEPTAKVDDDEVLICCAVPAHQESDSENRVQLAL
ncbi:pyridoxamine 5'-phosphate oxidase family protein [Pollutimonas harenae]|uniref:Pyridoxamine 5'-phosphate oxidase family protein n=1 Tax=Pollutimonas harenae TaxID=657015 RepID=A0A853H552_9BURK|nr:pyridoxamine 5'-phosphate oxidase family protein [Pollutimonas harenae]NYT87049.1 pyridoxamine 5'-phosphate oxidase family protein [Pollutimonas harenae]TEA72978.1 2Fe-2S iron-sulfur cluster binding domain-containing protein [Pollutimonas harenae]